MFIRLYGTTDTFDTAYTERLHIDFAKDVYAATNRKDEFTQLAMAHMARKEKSVSLRTEYQMAGG